MMPVMNGWKFLDEVAQVPALQTIPIVVLTGLDDEELGLRLIQTGAQDYLVKGQVTGPLLTRALRYAVEPVDVARDAEIAVTDRPAPSGGVIGRGVPS